MNGLRSAPQDFCEFIGGVMQDHLGMKRGVIEPMLFVDPNSSVVAIIHVDDVLAVGSPADLERFWARLGET
eukprot:1407795-Alexandrium_andersonii.AAC.1